MKTIEEKAKAYDEIIERAKTMLSAGEVMYGKENNASQLITDLIPELRESEDERIRKEMIKYFTEIKSTVPIGSPNHFDRYIAYLEKQKEQKVSRLHPEDYPMTPGECIKPAWSENERIINQLFARLFDSSAREYVKEQKPAEKQDYSGLTDFERAIHRGFLCAGVEKCAKNYNQRNRTGLSCTLTSRVERGG